MKLFLKLVSVFILCAVVCAQERDSLFKRPSFLKQNPIGNFVGGVRERVKEGSDRVKEGVRNGIQSIVDEVHKRTQQLEQTFTGHLSRLRPQAVDASKKLKEIEEQKKRLNEKLTVFNQEFNEKKSEYKEALKEQKDVLDNQLSAAKDPAATNELKNESEEIVKKIKMVDDLQLEPGLGDGYGRHL